MDFLIIFAIGCIIYLIYTKEKRAEERKKKEIEFRQKKLDMHKDPSAELLANAIVETITDLSSETVKWLRNGDSFSLFFENGSVFVEKTWYSAEMGTTKNVEYLLDRTALGKNPLTSEENEVFAGLVDDKLKKFYWLDVRFYSKFPKTELIIRKAGNTTIPEAF